MALSTDRNLEFYASQELIDLPVDDDVRIYKGAFVGHNRSTGYARPLVAGDAYLGVAYRQADNTAAGHVAGGVNVRLHQAIDIVAPLVGVTVDDIGKDVYASDDETLTVLPAGNSRMGRVVAVEATNVARVRCCPVHALGGALENWPMVELADADMTLTLDHINRTLLIANAAVRTLTLPPAALVRAGGWLRLVKASPNAFAVTLDAYGSELIDGATSYAGVDAQYDCVLLLCTGSEWVVLSRDLS